MATERVTHACGAAVEIRVVNDGIECGYAFRDLAGNREIDVCPGCDAALEGLLAAGELRPAVLA